MLIKVFDDDGIVNGARQAELIDQYFLVVDEKSNKLIDISGSMSSGSRYIQTIRSE